MSKIEKRMANVYINNSESDSDSDEDETKM